jgi:ClpP class serine protease
MSAIDHVYGVAWAIRPEALGALCQLVERADITPEALALALHGDLAAREAALLAVEQRAGARIEQAQLASRRGRVAVLPVVGPIARYANLFSSVSGGTSVQLLARDFTVALEDPKTEAILLAVDSPGGEVAGIAELAEMIHRARSVKPVWAYVSDLGASAAYWLASAAEQIVIAETAALGSIGVVAAVKDPDRQKADEIEFVSSVSPRKRADPRTDAGKAQLQGLVDSLGQIFVEHVARYRGVSAETVEREYGSGGLLVGRDAVTAGLAERLGSFEGTLDDLHAHLDEAAEAAPEPTPLPTRKRGRSMAASVRARFARFLASLDPPDAEALADAIDGVAAGDLRVDAERDLLLAPAPASAVPPPPPPPEEAPMPEMPPVSVPIALAAPPEPEVPPAIAQRLAALEAENARLHAARIEQNARAFAEEQVREMRANQTQVEAITALHAALAADDERLGGLFRADGSRIARVALLGSFFASQPNVNILGKEMLEAAGGRVMWDRATAPKKDPEAEPDDERVAQLLGHTAVGRQVLLDAGRLNGAART